MAQASQIAETETGHSVHLFETISRNEAAGGAKSPTDLIGLY